MSVADTQEREGVAARGVWEVRVADDLEEASLRKTTEFLRRFTPAGVDPVWSVDYFKWKLGERNPAGRGLLTCAVAGGDVVGVTSLTPKRIWFRRTMLIGAEIGDTYTHPDFLRASTHREGSPPIAHGHSTDHRTSEYLSRSIFGRLVSDTRARAIDRGMRLIYGTPNQLSRPGYEKRLNFRSHPTHHNQTFVRPTAQGVLGRYRRLRRGSWMLHRGEQMFGALTRALTVIQAGGRYALARLERSSGELDELWDRLKGQREFSLVRDRLYFQHRFFDHPLANYVVHTASRDGRIHGVMVTRVMKTGLGKRYCGIADWLVDASHARLFPLLLAHVIRAHDREPLDGFQLWCAPQGGERLMLHRLGFIRVGEAPIIFFQNAEGHDVLHTCPSLDFTLASSDNI